MGGIYERIWKGSLPGYVSGKFTDRNVFYSSYLQTYIDRDVGVSDDTARRWLQVLEKSDIIFYLRPYSNNLLKRTIKTPKMYFFDTGLVAYLTRYTSPEILQK